MGGGFIRQIPSVGGYGYFLVPHISKWQLFTVTLSVSNTLITETPVTALQHYCHTAVAERLSLQEV